MAGPSDTNPVNNKTNVEVCQEIANENEAMNEAPEDRERWIRYYRVVRDRMRRFGENIDIAMDRVAWIF
ncbi:hypothetical protein L3Y34_006452 [Caenorhabditis briggsae]|uniref:Uncharacterized protein n=1 Tax=Caenorhabditis briggsae TaxID=6238 RepID=A0AAE8ZWX9_CAEBR|nr:hypothetical protein L3Y34_006452 [Caenorhabditis briggsae]